MKVLSNKNKKDLDTLLKNVTCENCGSELELEERDLTIGELGLYKFKCPCCNEYSYVDDGITLTLDNLEYPTHYRDYSDGVDISKEEINKEVRRGIEYLRKNKEHDQMSVAFGNVLISIYRDDESSEFYISVSKNYKDVFLPYSEYDCETFF